MSWLRRRMMANVGGGEQHDADRYIQNGLVFQLDGIEKGNDATKWIDRKGGISFALSGPASPASDHVHFNGTGIVDGSSNITPEFDYEDATLDIVCTYQQGSHIPFIQPRAPFISFGFYANGIISKAASNNEPKPIWGGVTLANMKTYSLSANHAIANISNSMSIIGSDFWAISSNIIALGGRSGRANNYTGDIYAIRIYSRQLSVEEMQFNQRIDNVRFQLGIVE